MSYNDPNEILDTTEEAYQVLIEQHSLEYDDIQRWQWGEPNIMLIWEDSNEIRKNINSYISDEGDELWVEMNSWKDVEHSDATIRYWDNSLDIEPVHLDNQNQSADIQTAVENAYDAAEEITTIDELENEEDVTLSPEEKELLEEH